MSQINFAQLLRAGEGLTQWRPMLLGFLTLVAAAVLMVVGVAAGGAMRGGFGAALAGLCVLLAGVLMAAGMSGVGILLMDKAKGVEPRALMDALVAGLWCLPKLLGFAVVIVLVLLALALLGVLGYLLCKIPGIGALFLFVLHPVLVIVAAVVLTALFWVAIPLFTPAVWDGRSFKEALALVLAVARTRLVQTVVLLLGLYVVVSIIGMLVATALFPGYAFMSGLAASVLDPYVFAGGMHMLSGMFSPYGGGYGGSGLGLLYAGVLATVLIFGVAFTLMAQVGLLGMNLVYLSATEGLDIRATQEELDAGLAQARERAQHAKERARQAAEQMQERAREAAEQAREHARQRAQERAAAQAAAEQAASEEAARREAEERAVQEAGQTAPDGRDDAVAEHQVDAPAAACPKCHEVVGADDLFCGACGHRLKQVD